IATLVSPPLYGLKQQQQQQHGLSNGKQNGSNNNFTNDETKTIWIGDLFHWMDETFLHNCFSHTGQVRFIGEIVCYCMSWVVNVKVIRNKQTGQSEGYGFVEFYSRAAAEKVLQSYSGSLMPNTDQPFRLNWATFSGSDRRTEACSDLSIFVGDLAPDVTDSILQETFSSKYPSVKGAKVIIDSNTGRTKGYGFVRFGDENERSRAMTEMNGVYCSSRPMRIDVATPKKASGYQQQYSSQALDLLINDHSFSLVSFSFNTPVFLYLSRKDAEVALQKLQGTAIGKQTVRLSWGRNPGNKQGMIALAPFPLSYSCCSFLLKSGEEITVTTGMGHTMEVRAIVAMDMLFRQIKIQTCMLQQRFPVLLKKYEGSTTPCNLNLLNWLKLPNEIYELK
ncbi:hypothetical protein CUMW_185220, partial [Citrus unshiu]